MISFLKIKIPFATKSIAIEAVYFEDS